MQSGNISPSETIPHYSDLIGRTTTITYRGINYYDIFIIVVLYATIIYLYYKIKDNPKYIDYVNRKGKHFPVVKIMKWVMRLYPWVIVVLYGVQYYLMLTLGGATFGG